ncbi:MAG: alpha/beta hydrolase [Betaproteobacteria bacterium]|nr:alpha/beta hydrolase [Betaproteobacteria bacterium]
MPTLTVPRPAASFDVTMHDGAVIRVRRHGNPEGLRLVLCHGNGFAIDAYVPFWGRLLERFDIVLYDQRNHGQNPRHTVEAHDLPNFVRDMETVFHAIRREFGERPAVGVFHSISGVTSLWHALEYGKRWDALVMVDPALIPAPGLPAHEVAHKFETMLAHWSKGRKDDFADPAELAAHFAKSKSLRRWVPGAHELMARSILRQDEKTGRWHLCCPPAGESRVYTTNYQTHISHRFAELPMPAKVIGADPDQPDAQAPGKVARAMHAQFGHPYEAIPDTSHMLLIEKPAECERALLEFVEKFKL